MELDSLVNGHVFFGAWSLVQGLLALSALVRQYKPALKLLRLEGGLQRLVDLASEPPVQRCVLFA